MACSGSIVPVRGWGFPPVFFVGGLPRPPSAPPSLVHALGGERCDQLDCRSCCGVPPCCAWPRGVPRLRRPVCTRTVRPPGWGLGTGFSGGAVVPAGSLALAGSGEWGCLSFPLSLCHVLEFGWLNFPLACGGFHGWVLLGVGLAALSGSVGVAPGALAGGGGGRGGGVAMLGVHWLLPLGSCCVVRRVRLTVSVWRVAVLRCFLPVASFPPLPG